MGNTGTQRRACSSARPTRSLVDPAAVAPAPGGLRPVNLTAVLLTGLLAGGVSCAAVQGGLLAGLITRQRRAGQPTAPARVPAGNQREFKAPAQHGAHPTATPARATLGDDLTPVGAFLAGKLISHTALGALLGMVGTAVQLSVRAHTVLQLLAGVLIIAFGLAQLGVPGFRRSSLSHQPPSVGSCCAVHELKPRSPPPCSAWPRSSSPAGDPLGGGPCADLRLTRCRRGHHGRVRTRQPAPCLRSWAM